MWMMTSLFSQFLETIYPPLCYGCKREGSLLCPKCLNEAKKSVVSPHPFIISYYSFKSPLIKRAVHAIKYFHRKDLLTPLGEKLAEEITRQNLNGTLIPIPMHPFRQMIRGYNHGDELVKILASITSLPHTTTALKRTSLLKQQVKTTSRKERYKNQHNAFTVVEDVLEKNIILIDDVTTTGATLLEARKVLLHAGAKNVWAVTIAH